MRPLPADTAQHNTAHGATTRHTHHMATHHNTHNTIHTTQYTQHSTASTAQCNSAHTQMWHPRPWWPGVRRGPGSVHPGPPNTSYHGGRCLNNVVPTPPRTSVQARSGLGGQTVPAVSRSPPKRHVSLTWGPVVQVRQHGGALPQHGGALPQHCLATAVL